MRLRTVRVVERHERRIHSDLGRAHHRPCRRRAALRQNRQKNDYRLAAGKLWLDALTTTVVPLAFSLLVTGIVGAAASAGGNRLAPRALAWFPGLLIGACLLSPIVTTYLLQLWPVPAAEVARRNCTGG
jgi:hypothetical protein